MSRNPMVREVQEKIKQLPIDEGVTGFLGISFNSLSRDDLVTIIKHQYKERMDVMDSHHDEVKNLIFGNVKV